MMPPGSHLVNARGRLARRARRVRSRIPGESRMHDGGLERSDKKHGGLERSDKKQ